MERAELIRLSFPQFPPLTWMSSHWLDGALPCPVVPLGFEALSTQSQKGKEQGLSLNNSGKILFYLNDLGILLQSTILVQAFGMNPSNRCHRTRAGKDLAVHLFKNLLLLLFIAFLRYNRHTVTCTFACRTKSVQFAVSTYIYHHETITTVMFPSLPKTSFCPTVTAHSIPSPVPRPQATTELLSVTV